MNHQEEGKPDEKDHFGNIFRVKDGKRYYQTVEGEEAWRDHLATAAEFVIRKKMTLKEVMNSPLYNPGLYLSVKEAEAAQHTAVENALRGFANKVKDNLIGRHTSGQAEIIDDLLTQTLQTRKGEHQA